VETPSSGRDQSSVTLSQTIKAPDMGIRIFVFVIGTFDI
jgi:hypothetical protein